MFVDAETDGLYGDFLSVAAIVVDEEANEIDCFYKVVRCSAEDLQDEWTKANVLPIMRIDELDSNDLVDNEATLMADFLDFYRKYNDAAIIADVTYPVECRLFEKITRMDMNDRKFIAPFPLMDLSSMLYARGIEPLKDREKLVGESTTELIRHNALDDVRMSIIIWKKYIKGGE